MSFDLFTDLAKAYGSHVEKWPEQHHALYASFEKTEEGRSVLKFESLTDHLLAQGISDLSPSPGFEARLYAVAGAGAAASSAWDARFVRLSLRGFAACIVLGLAFGIGPGYAVTHFDTAMDAVGANAFGLIGFQEVLL